MNYLAHLYLAEDNPESLLGNFLGDFVKGSTMDFYNEGIRCGIMLHRQVDAYTDSHPTVTTSKALISPLNRRYASIAIDIFYDHFLACQWQRYSRISLESFARKIYQILEDHRAILPTSLQKALPNIVARNVLLSYADLDGISRTLDRLSRRIRRENHLGDAIADLVANYDLLASHFHSFFPDLIDFVERSRGRPHP
jgi:acyl carrier protein phosphodiesterase